MISKINDKLYVGNKQDPHQWGVIKSLGIRTIVNATPYFYVPMGGTATRPLVVQTPLIDDGQSNTARDVSYAIEVARAAYLHRAPVLIHCAAGTSRSPAIAAAVLVTSGDAESWAEAARIVSAARDEANLSTDFARVVAGLLPP